MAQSYVYPLWRSALKLYKPFSLALALAAILGILLSSAKVYAQADQATGKIRIYTADDFTHGKSQQFYHLQERLGDKEFLLKFKDGKAPDWLRDGSSVKIRGRRNLEKGEIDVEALESASASSSASTRDSTVLAAGGSGRSVAVLMLDFNDGTHYRDRAALDSDMFGATNSVTDVYNKTTDGVVSFNRDSDGDGQADIFGPLKVNVNGSGNCDYNTWAAEGVKAALASGVDTNKFQHVIYVLPSNTGCSWWGLGGGRNSWVRAGGAQVYAHELGHNLAMHHASTDPENDGTINSEYGDYSCIMGNSSNIAGLNGAHAESQGTYSAFQGRVLNGAKGTYTLDSVDRPPIAATNAQIIKIPKPNTNSYYYLTYRAGENYGAKLSSTYKNRLNVHTYRGSGMTQTLFVGSYGVGQEFVDAINGVSVRVVSQAEDLSNITIEVDVICVEQAPSLAISSAQTYLSPNSAATVSVSIRNNDSIYCPSTQFDLSGVSQLGEAKALTSSVNLAAGQASSFQVQLTTAQASGSGTYTVLASDNDGQDPAHADASVSASATIDSFAPTAPSNVTAAIVRSRIDVKWSGSTDVGTGLANYRVLRDGVAIGTSTSTVYSDTSAPAGATVVYQVVAVDRAGNQSGLSNAVSIAAPSKGRKGGGGGKPR